MFQSTPSGGKATQDAPALGVRDPFQSTPSGGKATARIEKPDANLRVSIHAFRGEGDASVGDYNDKSTAVSIHAFRGEGDLQLPASDERHNGFNPRLPGGRRRSVPADRTDTRGFNPRLPGGRRPRRGNY